MKPLHAWRWRRRIRAVWTRVEKLRRDKCAIRDTLAGVRILAATMAASRMVHEGRVSAAEALAKINAVRAEELRRRYGADAIDV